jgi:hypothetical protein
MAAPFLGIAAEALNVLSPLVAPIAWLLSPSFRARKRKEWEKDGRRLQIAEVGLWFVVWVAVVAASALILMDSLSRSAPAAGS